MNTGDVQTQIIAMITTRVEGVVDVSNTKITADSSFSELKMDSLSLVEAVMEVEQKFNIEIPDDVASKFTKVGDVIKHVEECLSAKTSA